MAGFDRFVQGAGASRAGGDGKTISGRRSFYGDGEAIIFPQIQVVAMAR